MHKFDYISKIVYCVRIIIAKTGKQKGGGKEGIRKNRERIISNSETQRLTSEYVFTKMNLNSLEFVKSMPRHYGANLKTLHVIFEFDRSYLHPKMIKT